MQHLEDYQGIVGDKMISQIFQQSKDLYGKKVLHLNSSYRGGGVAEVLNRLVPLMSDLGVEAEWRVIHGAHDFFTVTNNSTTPYRAKR